MNNGILTQRAAPVAMPYGLLGRPLPVRMPDSQFISIDADAEEYCRRVASADGAPMELAVQRAIHGFVVGCKTDGIWSAIKASCVLMGARTLSGALTPLVGTAPTNNNFVSGDYNRKTGLKGDATTKWLNSRRNNNADGQDDFHMACYASESATTSSRAYMGAGSTTNETGASNFGASVLPQAFFRCRGGLFQPFVLPVLLVGVSRSTSGSYSGRGNNNSLFFTATSQFPTSADHGVFSASGGNFKTEARFAFYSIGSSLSLPLLDARVTALYNALAAAIA